MFKYLIEQLQNASQVIYDGAQCRAFLIQAYQESLSIRPKLEDQSEKKLLERFYSVNKDLIELSDDRFNTKQTQYQTVIAKLIEDMESH